MHGYIEGFTDKPHGPRMEIGQVPWADCSTTTKDAGQMTVLRPYVETKDITGQGPDELREQISQDFVFTEGAYAREFADDPNAEILNDAEISVFVDIVNELQAAGYTIVAELTPLVSAEDESTDRSGGLQTVIENGRNVGLGEARVRAFINGAQDAGLPDNIQFVEKATKEQVLTDAQYAVVENLVHQFGYNSPKELVDVWNADRESTPPVVDTLFSGWFDSHRGVSVTLIGTKQVEEPGKDQTVGTQEVCIIPIVDVKMKDYSDGTWSVTIPMPAAVLLLGSINVGLFSAIGYNIASNMRRSKMGSSRSRSSDHGLGSGGSKISSEMRQSKITVAADAIDGTGKVDRGTIQEGESYKQESSKAVPEKPVEERARATEKSKKLRKKLPWLIAVPLVTLAGYKLGNNDWYTPEKREIIIEDDCRTDDMPEQERNIGTRTITRRNGHIVDVDTEFNK